MTLAELRKLAEAKEVENGVWERADGFRFTGDLLLSHFSALLDVVKASENLIVQEWLALTSESLSLEYRANDLADALAKLETI